MQECIDTNGLQTLLEVTVLPNVSVPFHQHQSFDEYIQVLEGVFYTTINGVDRAYAAGESFVFPQNVIHRWWTGSAQGAKIRLKLAPCFDGFHESVEIFSNLPNPHRAIQNPWIMATLYNIGGTVLKGPWYQWLVLWILKRMARSKMGQQWEQELM